MWDVMLKGLLHFPLILHSQLWRTPLARTAYFLVMVTYCPLESDRQVS
jgi:hypothetical protein